VTSLLENLYEIRLRYFVYELLPNTNLNNGSTIAYSFMERGVDHFHDACDYVWKLPYGRNSDRADLLLVLSEKKGTCSTKHALLKALADEINLKLDLVVGIYPMNEKNTPGVGKVLSDYQLDYIPEAHCYLKYQDQIIDVTRSDLSPEEKIIHFFLKKSLDHMICES